MLLSRKPRLIFFLIFACLFASQNAFSLQEKSHISLTRNDKKNLSIFFKLLFRESTAGYVLFGEKPVFLSSYKVIDDSEAVDKSSYDWIITKGVDVLEKLKLENKNYILSVSNYRTHSGFKEIMFINKRSFLKTIEENLPFFQSELKEPFSAQEILDKILSNSFLEFFENRKALQGIALGYGTENAIAYERVNRLISEAEREGALDKVFQSHEERANQDGAIRREVIAYALLNSEEWGDVVEQLEEFSSYEPTDDQSSLNVKAPFSYLPHSEESKAIIEAYTGYEKTVSELLKDKNFLSKVLQKLD